jgi:hypothetical protein
VRVAFAVALTTALLSAQSADSQWLTWSAKQAEAIARAGYAQGRVGGLFDGRLLKTERAYNYKLAATWMSPDVVRATARTIQLSERLSESETRTLVATAASIPGIVVMVEIDPREGSGVIPNDWTAILRSRGADQKERPSVRGVNTPSLRDVRVLAGINRRNYDYDRFWVVFPASTPEGVPVVAADAPELELVVRVADKEGTVRWPVPQDPLRRP